MSDLNEFQEVLDFWFPDISFQKFWFDGSVDREITTRFSSFLYQAEEGVLQSWANHNLQSKLALIIVLDQFSRNIYRYYDFRKNDNLALPLAMSIIESYQDLELPIHQRVFVYLPLRHQRLTKFINIVISRLELINKKNLTDDELNIVIKFKRATERTHVIDT